MACFNVTHLVRRGNVFCFRMAVPRSLWARFGLREIKGSLKTTDPFTARVRCRKLSNAFENLIDQARTMPDLTQQKIKDLIRSYFQQCLDQTEEFVSLAPEDDQLDLDAEIAGMEAEIPRLRKNLAAKQYGSAVRAEVREILDRSGIPHATVDLEEVELLCNGVMRSWIEDRRIRIAKLRGQYDALAPKDLLFSGMEAKMPPPPGQEEAADRSLATLANRFCEQKRDKEWVPKTYLDNQRVVNLAISLIGGNRLVSLLDIEDVRKVRDTLEKLPGNYMKSKEMQGASISEILAAGKESKPLAPKTQEKYFTMFRSFLKWCISEGYLAAMPGPNLKIAGSKKGSGKKDRNPFTEEQLQTFFSSPLYTGCKSEGRRSDPGDLVIRDGKFWIPVIALHSGLRLGEIAQLLVSDVKEEKGIVFFDINKGEGEEDKLLKTWSSIRRVPVHPLLTKAGLMDHVEQQRKKNPKGRVFPEVMPGKYGYYSANFSKWFSRYATAVAVKTSKTSFHSFRHNFKDALRDIGCAESVSKALMGHADDSVHGNYGSDVPVTLLAQAVEKICYPVDFSFLSK